MQEQPDGKKKRAIFWARTMTAAEQRYNTTHGERLAVILGCPYLEGHKCTIRTSHDAMKWILTLTAATGKLEPSQLGLSDFEFKFEHRAGMKNLAADA